MATITPTVIQLEGEDSIVRITWETLTTTNDTGSVFKRALWNDRSIQVTGTFGSGGTLKWQGSNDGTNYVTLTDPQGNDLSFTAAGFSQVSEVAVFMRPFISAGDGTTDIDVTLLAIRGSNRRGG